MRLGALCIGFVLVGCSLEQGTAPMWTFDDAPGAPPVDGALTERLATAWAARATDYVPRTQHVRPDGSPKYINRLFLESTPTCGSTRTTPSTGFRGVTKRLNWPGRAGVRCCSPLGTPPATGVT